MSPYTSASDTMMAHPLALQLRNLQSLFELGVDKNTTVVFPAPLMSTGNRHLARSGHDIQPSTRHLRSVGAMAGASRTRAPLPADIVVPRVRPTGSATLNTSTVTACTDAQRPCRARL
ncbi:MAG: hypothetical protein LC644_06145 [Pseudonocardia sp.]|nr:hypothetical protein [Pseudonocardia sp.]